MVHTVSDEVHAFQLWMLQGGRDCGTIKKFMEAYIPRVQQDVQVPVHRMMIGTQITHPQIGVYLYKYLSDPDRFTEFCYLKADIEKNQDRLKESDAPFLQLIRGAKFVRNRASDEYQPEDIRFLFQDEGFTDYYSLPVYINGEYLMGISWGTKSANGFTDEHIRFFDQLQPIMGTTLVLLLNQCVSHFLLCSYLGEDTGTRVFRGSVDRGDGDTMRSVIWFSDIRGFTKMSCEMERDAVIDLINDVCEVTEDVLGRHGGEILKVMGDGIMGVFIDPDKKRTTEDLFNGGESALSEMRKKYGERRPSSSLSNRMILCENARKAAKEFQQRLGELRSKRKESGLAEPEVGVGLHYGDSSYGNVGGKTRLDFTVIGKEVNLASRIEGLCSKLGVCVLATEDFVRRDTDETGWKSRGEHTVKGVPEPVPVYELDLDE